MVWWLALMAALLYVWLLSTSNPGLEMVQLWAAFPIIMLVIGVYLLTELWKDWRWPVEMDVPSDFIVSYDHDWHPRGDIATWLHENRMKIRIEHHSVRFRSPKDAVLFKMRWM